jgi:chromosome segregation ATPase
MGGVETRLSAVETRLEGVETRLEGVETRLEGVETRLEGVETRLGTLENKFDAFATETRENFDELRASIKFSYAEIDRRMTHLETVVADLSARVLRLEHPPGG